MDYLGKGEVLTNTDLDRFVNNIWEKWAFCVYRKSLRSLSSAHEKWGQKQKFIILFSVYILSSQRSFSIIVQMSAFSSCFMCLCCQIFTNFYSKCKNNFDIVSNIWKWTLTGLKQLSFTWLSRHLFFSFEKSLSLKYDHQAFEKCLFVHFLIIIVLHCIICVDNQTKHFNIILLRLIIGDIEWRLIFIWCTVINILLIYVTRYLFLFQFYRAIFHHFNYHAFIEKWMRLPEPDGFAQSQLSTDFN